MSADTEATSGLSVADLSVTGHTGSEDVAGRVELAMDRFLKSQEDLLHEMAAPLQDVTGPLRTLLLGGGKRLRATLCYWGWRGAGRADCPEIIAAAASFELLHGGALIHDDVMDNSDTRRGHPTAHRHFATLLAENRWRGATEQFGMSAAILLGDLCLSWSDQALDECGMDPDARARGRTVLHRARTEVMGGQYLDLRAGADHNRSVDQSRLVIRYKTAKYTIERPLHLGAALAGGGPQLIADYTSFALSLGEAFQLRDDILGVFGDPERLGKPVSDDLREGKSTVLMCTAAERANQSQSRDIQALFGLPELSHEGTTRLHDIIRDTGALAIVEGQITQLVESSLAVLTDRSPIHPDTRDALRNLAIQATSRDN